LAVVVAVAVVVVAVVVVVVVNRPNRQIIHMHLRSFRYRKN
jgi:hypothetical protein